MKEFLLRGKPQGPSSSQSFELPEFQSSFPVLPNPFSFHRDAIRFLKAPNGIRVTIHTNAHIYGDMCTHIAQIWALKSGSLLPLLVHRIPGSPQALHFPSQVSLSCCSCSPNDSLFLSRLPSLCLLPSRSSFSLL